VRMRRLLVLLLIFALLAPALPAKAQESYYALSFDGEDDYGSIDNPSTDLSGDLSIVMLLNVTKWGETPGKGKTFISKHYKYEFDLTSWNPSEVRFYQGNGTNYKTVIISGLPNGIFLLSVIRDTTNKEIKAYVNGTLKKTFSYTVPPAAGTNPILIGNRQNEGNYFEGSIYLILIYNRALSDTEIQQIYNDPLNPPTDGLALWLAPDSVDTANDKWTDKSGQGNDGTIYGATAERVSIPKLYVYDANTSEQISYTNVSLTLYFNNTTAGLIPSIPILPWNETVTLNVSATNYESRTISTWTGVDLISVYLEPIGTTTEKEETLLTQPTEPPTAPTEPFFNYTNDYGFLGFRLGDKLMHFQIDEVIPEFFNLTPIFAIFIPLIMTLSIGVAAWYYSRNSLVVLGVLAVMNTFFFLLGLKVELSMVGSLTALVIFFVAWIFWDLYKSKERV